MHTRRTVIKWDIGWSWYTGLWWVGCYIRYSEDGPERAAAPPSPVLAVPNITANPSTASVPITVLLYDGPLLCGFNVAIKAVWHFEMTENDVDRHNLCVHEDAVSVRATVQVDRQAGPTGHDDRDRQWTCRGLHSTKPSPLRHSVLHVHVSAGSNTLHDYWNFLLKQQKN